MSQTRCKSPVQPFKELYGKALEYPEQKDRFVNIDGFGKYRQKIENWFIQHGKVDNTKFFVLKGPQSGGNTSLANYIVHCYNINLDVNENDKGQWRVLKVPVQVKNERNVEALQDWMEQLDIAIGQERINLDKDIKKDIGKILDIRHEDLPETSRQYRDTFNSVAESLHGQSWHIAAIFDKVKSDKLYSFCKDVFISRAPLVIFVEGWQTDTEGHQLTASGGTPTADSTWPKGEYGMHLTLNAITGHDVIVFLEHCWKTAYGVHHQPFNEQCIEELFDKFPNAVGKVIATLSFILDLKLKQFDTSMEWPVDSMRIDVHDIFSYLLEKSKLQ
jgi:hypothetical protein